MIDKLHFASLSKSSKLEYLHSYGELICELEYAHARCSLFLFRDFFVEIYFDRQKDQISLISIADHANILYKYVEALELDFLQHN